MGDKIAENEKITDLEENIKGLKMLNEIAAGFDCKIEVDIETLERELQELKNLSDKFNEMFSSSGWIAHESLSVDVMKDCVDRGIEGESLLVTYYEGKLEWFINVISYKRVFKERAELLRLVKEDYFSERYHSCVPVVLMLADGIVNDIKPTGLFADATELDIWDSIAGHSTGLNTLVGILKKNRKKTNTESINLPYRNGILHGREMSYANKIVAIKSFAILFYIHDWMMSLESEETRKKSYQKVQTLKEEISFQGILEQYKHHKLEMEILDKLNEQWEPRKLEKSYKNFVIEIGTPEEKAILFLECIKNQNYGTPVSLYLKNIHGDVSVKDKAGKFRKDYENIEIINYFVNKIEDQAPAVSHVYITVEYKSGGTINTKKLDFRMIYEKGNECENRLVTGGEWKIVNIEGIINQMRC